jgi:hypothetical protein
MDSAQPGEGSQRDPVESLNWHDRVPYRVMERNARAVWPKTRNFSSILGFRPDGGWPSQPSLLFRASQRSTLQARAWARRVDPPAPPDRILGGVQV